MSNRHFLVFTFQNLIKITGCTSQDGMNWCQQVKIFADENIKGADSKYHATVVQRKDFRMPFDVIMIYTKQSTSLAIDNSEMAVIGLSLKWRQPCVCPLIDQSSRPMKS